MNSTIDTRDRQNESARRHGRAAHAAAAPAKAGFPIPRSAFMDRAVFLLIGLYLLTLPLMTHDIRAADEIEYFAYVRSLAFDHDLDFQNEYTYFYNRFPEKYSCREPNKPDCKSFQSTFMDTITPTGLRPNFGPIGTAILWAPFFGAGHLVALGLRAAGTNVAVDGFSKPYLWAITLGSALYSLAGLLLAYALCRRLVGQAASFWATLTIWLGTPVIFYSHLAPGYSHAASLFAVALFLYLWAGWRDDLTPRRAVALGVVGGLIAMIREQDALFLLTPVLYGAFGTLGALRSGRWQDAAGMVARVALVGVAAVVTYLPQLLTYQILNGAPTPNKDVSDKMNVVSPFFWRVMTDPAHALPFWSPIVLLALVGLGLLARRDPRLAAALVLGFLLTWYINGAIKTWTTAGSFGARRFLNCTPIFIVGLAYAYQALLDAGRDHPALRRALVPLLSALAIAWNLGLVLQFVLAEPWMNRQLLEWPRVLVNQFRLPAALPGIIQKFIVDKGSFYAQ